MYIYIFFFRFFSKLLQNIECSSLCFTVSPCWLSTLYIVVCIPDFKCYLQTFDD